MSFRLIDMTLQQIFIANLKRSRKERGLSQMALSVRCDTTSNYIGQIEMGRRIPSFETIEKIAAALKIPPQALFSHNANAVQKEEVPKAEDYLQKMPHHVKKEIIANLLAAIKEDITASFDPQNY